MDYAYVKSVLLMKHLPVHVLILALMAIVAGTEVSTAADRIGGEAVRPSKKTRLHPQNSGGTLRNALPETSKFYCGERIIAPGDSRAAVLEKCGKPAWKEVREDVVTEAIHPDGTPVNLVTTEEWVYNFGSEALIIYLRFQGDSLAVIETGGYGYADLEFGQNCGDGKNISLGDSRFDVLVKCGVPTESGPVGVDDAGQMGRARVDGNAWMYDFGPDRFTYHLIFRNGRVSAIRTGGYGH
jgi:hypothetical protein